MHERLVTALIIAAFGIFANMVFDIFIKRKRRNPAKYEIAFLHPHCHAGGGGERVLWMSIVSAQKRYPSARISVYSLASKTSAEEICLKAKAIGMLLMGYECLLRYRPDVIVDTEGCAFSYIPLAIAKVPIISYVHYPFISSNMIQVVNEQSVAVNNSSLVARSGLLSRLKHKYYKFLVRIYGLCGSMATSAMANSEWTLCHLSKIWPTVKCKKVFPPCDLSLMGSFDLKDERDPVIFSLSQFRPEKNQIMQIYVMKRLLELMPECIGKVKLVMYGGCRDATDAHRADSFKALSKELGVEESVEIKTNICYDEILRLLSKASIGIHTMKEEHFGISIVEFMASGVIAVANNSGGPKSDIIHTDEDGFLCGTIEEYAQAIKLILSMPESRRYEIREKARKSAVTRFAAHVYEDQFLSQLGSVLTKEISE